MKEDIEQRAKKYAYKKHDDNFGNYPDNSIADYIAGATEERERGKRFAKWLFKNNLYFVNDDIFNSFLAEEKALNN